MLALAAVLLPSAAARADFAPCPPGQPAGVTCQTLAVPLDRSGAVPGHVNLLVLRHAPAQPSKGALVVLAGGPGQAATPLEPYFQSALAPALAGRDLIVFDQRGTGASDPLNCPALDSAASDAQVDRALEACANALGPGRAFYTSRDSADDIEAIRQSLGVDKIALYGVSYGTFVAMTYARRYPSHVESLVLDSVIHPDGRDPLDRSTFAAFKRVLRDICAVGCRDITRNPVATLSKLVRRLHRQPLSARFFTPSGRRRSGRIGEADVRYLLEGADFDPTVRAELPATLVSASNGDGAPLARLLNRELASSGAQAIAQQTAPATSGNLLYFATACEEIAFPWSRTAALAERPGQLAATLAGVPAAAFAPFDRQTEADTGTSRPCFGWPDGSPTSPLVGGPLPNVPALLLAGVDDTRTPIADAQAAAALLPQAQMVSVPETGHSVLGTDLGRCSSAAVASFFAAAPVGPCGPQSRIFRPAPVAPTGFSRVRAQTGVRGKAGKTIRAVKDTLNDSSRQAIGYVLKGKTIKAGGLRGGHMRGSMSRRGLLTLRLIDIVYVPGVRISGTETIDLTSGAAPVAQVRIDGGAAATGTLTLRGGNVRGRLDGQSVRSSRVGVSAAALGAPRLSPATLRRLRAAAALRRGP